MLRLNTAITPASTPNALGVIGGDLAGFPNGRRVFDDVVTIELRAIAGVTIPLVDPTFTPDAAAGLVTDGLTAQRPVRLPEPLPLPRGPATAGSAPRHNGLITSRRRPIRSGGGSEEGE